jgi:putative FmdB family regulatory protein
MPIYVYSCRTCELEMEELYPLGQAPVRGIRCPLCGGYFERDVALFHVGGRSQPVKLASSAMEQSEARPDHGVNCPCCPPLRRQSAGKQ